MPDTRWPKQLLFGHLSKTRPACGPRQRWKDVIVKDLKIMKLPAGGSWWTLAQNKGEWIECINTLDDSSRCPLRPGAPVFCDDCQRFFRRLGDLKRHKCRAERNLPVQDQLGAVHCTMAKCDRWFRR